MTTRPLLSRINLPTQIYAHLKQRIVGNDLCFGDKLTEFHLARELGVSRTPLREALNRLAQEGLVTVIPGRGAFVATFSPADIVGLFDVREALEGMAARLATPRIARETLVRLQHRLEAEMKKRSEHGYSGYMNADRELHETVTLASENRHLVEHMETLTDRIQMLRSQSVTLPGRVTKSFEEHLGIIEALSQRNADLAEERTRQHIRNVKADLATAIKESEDRHPHAAAAENRRAPKAANDRHGSGESHDS